MELTIRTSTADDTREVAAEVGRLLRPHDVVVLTGELGAGKTCFVQGLVRALGATTAATSPTFVLVNEYRGRLAVHHVDVYRTQSLTELLDFGLEELIASDGVTVVEWADRCEPLLPRRTIRVHLAGVGDEPRRITITEPTRDRNDRDSVSNSAH